MSSTASEAQTVDIHVENIGGITETEVSIPPGVTALVGRNATNRTSLLRAVMAALGSDDASLKADADEGCVRLSIGEETYTRTFRREGGRVVTEGEGYADATESADTFAFLLETNEARRAVERGADLRDVVLRPVDTAEIRRERRELEDERREIEERLSALDDLAERRERLRERREELSETLAAKREALREVEARIDAADTGDGVETPRETLTEVRADLEDVRYDIETAVESRDALREERADLRARLTELAPVESGERLAEQIDDLRRDRQQIENRLNALQGVIKFNREQLDGEGETVGAALGDGAVTDGLVGGDETVCWTCGSSVPVDQIEATVEQLQAYRGDLVARRDDIEDRLTELRERQESLADRQQQEEQLETRLAEVEEEIDEREERIAELETRREELQARVEELEAEIAAAGDDRRDELLDHQREASRLETEIERLEAERESVGVDIEELTDRLDERADLERERDRARERLEDARRRIDRIEEQVIEEFNHHMEALIEALGYGNVERIWLERRATAGATEDATFDLHVVRSDADGTVYEDSVDHLSESEREVTGFVFALAGYLTHEVHETVPVLVLDSLEAIDAERIAAVVDYLREYAPYLLVALLPEDAAHVSTDTRITDI